jgi:CubicO group peptidase (beta-lactamase class C family)
VCRHRGRGSAERRAARLAHRTAEIPGLSAAVVRDGAIAWSGAFGVRDTESRAPVTPGTLFDAASLTKPVVAYAALRLADRGVLSLDRPLADVVPNPRLAHDERHRRITPRMVLSHTTGLPNWGSDERVDMIGEPGRTFGYSGEGFVYLGQVMEKLTGKTIVEIVREETLVPLGMTRTSLVWVDSLETDGTRPHDAFGRAFPPNRRTTPNAAASLRTTAEDYARFLIATLEGRGLSARSRDQMRSPFTQLEGPRTRGTLFWGLGWGIEQQGDASILWHWGDNGTAKAFVAADPARGTGIVYFVNAQHGLAIADAMVSLVFPEPHDALRWLDYDRHDVPDWSARRAIVRAGADSGAEGALRRWREARAASRGPARLAAAAGRMLRDRGAAAAARAVLDDAVRSYPDSQPVLAALGDVALDAGDFPAATDAFRRALALTPRDSSIRASLAWAEENARLAAAAPALTPEAMARLAGEYGPRKVLLEDGRLYYQRGSGPKRALAPLGTDLFAPEGLGTFRLQFVLPGEGPAEKVVGIYLGGNRDENGRTK